MTGHNTKSFGSDPPNRQNTGYVDVPVDNGTTRTRRYSCAGCETELSESGVNYLVESDRLKTLVSTKFGSLYVYASGSAYPGDNRTWPYCDDCFAAIKRELFAEPPTVRKKTSNGETYEEAACSRCSDRMPAEQMDTFVLTPTTVVHKTGGAGMTAASYPRIRGKAIRLLCPSCTAEFSPIEVSPSEGDDAE